jgi:hypothetical protein
MSLLPHNRYVPYNRLGSKKYTAFSYRKELVSKYHRPSLGVSGKIAATNGFVFKNAPMFKELLKNDDRDPKSLLIGGRDMAAGGDNPSMPKKDFKQ